MQSAMRTVRPAAVAGTFYPGTPAVLSADVHGYLADPGSVPASGDALPKALMVPQPLAPMRLKSSQETVYQAPAPE